MNQELPLISIVVPMHNSSEYIARCITSIINQDYQNFELLLIDDHSRDDTVQACQRYLSDSRIRLIINDGKNGASATRNLGMTEAKGSYISFVDSDDIIANNYLSVLYSIAIKHPNALAMCGYIEFNDEDDVSSLFKSTDKSSLLIIPSDIVICNIFYYHSSAWACLFRRDILIKYGITMEQKASFNEDVFFTCKYLSICEGAAMTNEKLYGYFENPNGIGAHKAHSDLTISDVNHRAEGYLALLDAIKFTEKHAPGSKKYLEIGYAFIAAEVRLTAVRAGVNKFNYDKEICRYLSLKNRLKFVRYGKNIKQKLLVNGIAISPKLIKLLLDDMNLLKLVRS